MVADGSLGDFVDSQRIGKDSKRADDSLNDAVDLLNGEADLLTTVDVDSLRTGGECLMIG